MSYKELFRENNEQYTERIALVMERIGDIAVDGAITVPEVYRGYFEQMANYLLLEHSVAEEAISGEFSIMTAAQGEQLSCSNLGSYRPLATAVLSFHCSLIGLYPFV